MSTHFAQGLIDLDIDLKISLHGILFWAPDRTCPLPHTSDGERVLLGYSGLAPYATRERQTAEVGQGRSYSDTIDDIKGLTAPTDITGIDNFCRSCTGLGCRVDPGLRDLSSHHQLNQEV